MAEVPLYDKINEDSQGDTEPNSLLQKLRNKITKSVQTKVDNILQDVQKLTDYDKLYLYLQLPAGPSAPEKSLDIGSVNTAEHMHACTWIRNHLEEHTDTCLPKQDVYDAYERYCDNLHGRPLSVANFGKIIREIFPNIKARRLGGRGQSKYCYSGLRRKSLVSLQPLPSLDLKVTESSELTDFVQSYNNDVINASSTLICSWAEKTLHRSFNNIVELSQFLIKNHHFNPRSANAELVLSVVLSENAPGSVQKTQKPADGEKGADSPDGGTDAGTKSKSPNVGSAQQSVKKRPPEPQKPVNSPQVDALMAKNRPVRPRPTSETIPISVAPSVLASNLIPGSLPCAAVPVTTGINGTGLMSPLIMFQPDLVRLETPPTPKAPHNRTRERAAGGGETKAPKRRGEAEPAAGATVKRKRGRPRKVASTNNDSAQTGAPSGFSTEKAAERGSSSIPNEAPGQDTLQCAVPELDTGGALPTATLSNTEGSVRGETINSSAPPPSAELQDPAMSLAGSAPIQVSVITDARHSVAFWTVMEEDANKRLIPPKEEHNRGWPPEKVQPLPEQ